MKVNIYGLSEATITFNTLGLTIRGNTNSGESIARNISIDSEDQANELRQVQQLRLVRVEIVEEEVVVDRVEEIVEESTQEVPEPVEEPTEEEEEAAQPTEKKASKSRKRGRPKKKVEKKVEVADKSENDVVVMTESGPKSGKMSHKMAGEIDENDERCKASMEAAQLLDDEENAEPTVIDESLLDPSERMGSQAVIGTGNGKSEVIDMKNSLTGRKDPDFIDLQIDKQDAVEDPFIGSDLGETDKGDVESAFIDNSFENEEVKTEDELGDQFIEY